MEEITCHFFHLAGFQVSPRIQMANLGITLVCVKLKENYR
jgi:hypothetical protein